MKNSRDQLAVLSSASLFKDFSKDDLAALGAKSTLQAFPDGGLVFDGGSEATQLFVVASGAVVVSSMEDGSTMAELLPGDSFGELEFLTHTARNARARAQGPTTVLAFPEKPGGLEEALSDTPEVAARVLRSFLLVISGRIRRANAMVKENSPWVRELKRQVYGDKLTGLLNKAYLEESLPGLMASPLALIMLKPDNFKEINDRFGHEVGDKSLVLMARSLADHVGKAGTAFRYLGNELGVIYQGYDRPRAMEAAKAIQSRLSSLDLSELTQDPGFRLSISLGIALAPGHSASGPGLVSAVVDLPLLGRGRGGGAILFPEDRA